MMEKNAEVVALIGNRPSCQPRRFQTEGELLGTVESGPRAEWRVYRRGDALFI